MIRHSRLEIVIFNRLADSSFEPLLDADVFSGGCIKGFLWAIVSVMASLVAHVALNVHVGTSGDRVLFLDAVKLFIRDLTLLAEGRLMVTAATPVAYQGAWSSRPRVFRSLPLNLDLLIDPVVLSLREVGCQGKLHLLLIDHVRDVLLHALGAFRTKAIEVVDANLSVNGFTRFIFLLKGVSLIILTITTELAES